MMHTYWELFYERKSIHFFFKVLEFQKPWDVNNWGQSLECTHSSYKFVPGFWETYSSVRVCVGGGVCVQKERSIFCSLFKLLIMITTVFLNWQKTDKRHRHLNISLLHKDVFKFLMVNQPYGPFMHGKEDPNAYAMQPANYLHRSKRAQGIF